MADHEKDKKHGESEGHGGGGHAGGSHGPPHGGGSHEEHEGAPEWLISFADNTALMMGFFVILLAMNMGPKAKGNPGPSRDDKSEAAKQSGQTPQQLDWVLSVREAFHNPVSVNSTNPRDKFLVMRLKEKMMQVAQDKGVHGDNTTVQSIRESDYRNFYANVAFETGSTEVSPDGHKTIDQVAEQLRGIKLRIELRGHASAAEAFGTADHGMKLSFERATAIAAMLQQQGFEWSQLRIIPCGDGDRIKPLAYDAQSHAQNQCVEIVLTEDTVKP